MTAGERLRDKAPLVGEVGEIAPSPYCGAGFSTRLIMASGLALQKCRNFCHSLCFFFCSCALDSFLVVRSKLTLASGGVAVAHSVEGHPDAGPAATSAEDESFYSAAEMLASITD